MKKIKIALVGAFDRNNFGDVLMPIVFKKQLLKSIDETEFELVFNYYSSTSSNMEYIKGENSQNISFLYKEKNDVVIIVGGDVLASNYTMMYMSSQKSHIKYFMLRLINKFFPSWFESVAKRKLFGRTPQPWIFDKDMLMCNRLIYNTVGGTIFNEQFIDRIDFISIRNSIDYEKVKSINANSFFSPDSMTLTSKIIEESEINENTSDFIKNKLQSPYIIIQMNNSIGESIYKTVILEIKKIIFETNYNVVLLPIGFAPMHDDQVVLKKIFREFKNRVILMPEINVYETLYTLKHSFYFIGTSLHGIVLSESFGIPYVLLTNKLRKLNNYLHDWNYIDPFYIDPSFIYSNFVSFLKNRDYLVKELMRVRTKHFKLVEKNFDLINQIIKNAI